jgi:hypothetical protein
VIVVAVSGSSPQVHYVAEHLRADDAREVNTATGLDPAVAVVRGVEKSLLSYVVHSEREHQRWVPIAVFGVAPSTVDGCGAVWFLSTDLTRKEMVAIRRSTPYWLDQLGRGFKTLHNLLDMRNMSHLRWCLKVGFNPGEIVRVNGKPFIHIYRPCAIPQY